MKLMIFRPAGAALLALSIFGACAPPPETIVRSSESVQSGPRLEDVDLHLDQKPQATIKIDWSEDVTAAVAYRLTENILALKGSFSPQDRSVWAKAFLQSLPHDRLRLADSDYADLLVKESEIMAKSSLDVVIPKLKNAPQEVRKALAKIKRPIGAKETVALEEIPDRVFHFLQAFNAQIDSVDVIAQVKSGLHEELGKYLRQEASVRRAVHQLIESSTIATALASVTRTASSLGFDLKGASAKINKAQRLANKVDSFTDAHGALSVLIDVWVYLEAGQRVAVFKTANAELYDYFNGLTREDLTCLQDLDCFSLPKWIARNLFIEPQIESYGLERLRQQVNGQGAAAVRDEVRGIVNDEVRGLPEVIARKVEEGIRVRSAAILRLQSDFSGEMRARLNRWAANHIENSQPSVFRTRPTRARLHIADSGHVDLVWTGTGDANTESAGALSSLSILLWQQSNLSAVDARSLILNEIASLARQYRNSIGLRAESTTARAFAESIRGSAFLAVAFRDWERNTIDDLIGAYSAQELFPEFQMTELAQPLFPKPAFFALSFASLADKLKMMTVAQTPVFVIDAHNRLIPSNESTAGDDSAVMAGIADRINGQLAPTVRAEDVARYLLAMCQTLEAMSSIERSTSSYLLKADADGKIPRDEIIANRESIRLLVLGLANYLSHQFRAGGDLILSELHLATQEPVSQIPQVMDQMLAIRALVAASNALDTEIYRWEAVDLVSAMNRQMYRGALGFYAATGENQVAVPALLESLRAMDDVAPYLRVVSRQQIEKLSRPWREKVTKWRLGN